MSEHVIRRRRRRRRRIVLWMVGLSRPRTEMVAIDNRTPDAKDAVAPLRPAPPRHVAPIDTGKTASRYFAHQRISRLLLCRQVSIAVLSGAHCCAVRGPLLCCQGPIVLGLLWWGIGNTTTEVTVGCDSKAHLTCYVFSIDTFFYLLPFLRYSPSKFVGFDLDLWPLKVTWSQKYSWPSKAHIYDFLSNWHMLSISYRFWDIWLQRF